MKRHSSFATETMQLAATGLSTRTSHAVHAQLLNLADHASTNSVGFGALAAAGIANKMAADAASMNSNHSRDC